MPRARAGARADAVGPKLLGERAGHLEMLRGGKKDSKDGGGKSAGGGGDNNNSKKAEHKGGSRKFG